MINKFLYVSALLIYNANLFAINSSIEARSYLHQPSGKYNVGYKEVYLINKNVCPNIFFKQKNATTFSKMNQLYCNEIELAVYYPSENKGSSAYKPIPSVISDLKEFDEHISEKSIGLVQNLRSHTTKNANLIKEDGHFPVVFLVPVMAYLLKNMRIH